MEDNNPTNDNFDLDPSNDVAPSAPSNEGPSDEAPSAPVVDEAPSNPELSEEQNKLAEKPLNAVAQEKGIKNLKELIQLGAAAAKVVREAKRNDGKYSATDLPLLMNLFPVMGPAMEDVSEVPAELKDLSMDELKVLLSFGAAHIGEAYSEDEELVEKVEAVLGVGLALVKAVKVFK